MLNLRIWTEKRRITKNQLASPLQMLRNSKLQSAKKKIFHNHSANSNKDTNWTTTTTTAAAATAAKTDKAAEALEIGLKGP